MDLNFYKLCKTIEIMAGIKHVFEKEYYYLLKHQTIKLFYNGKCFFMINYNM